MNNYFEVRVTPTPCNETITDILAALLADEGYESFVPDESGLTAYIKSTDYSRSTLEEALEAFPIADIAFEAKATEVEGRDWNREWEQNYFQPIVVADRCVIHSSFHHDIPKCEYDIVIDPKMAFGTGHHQTTSLIIDRLLNLDLCDKHVIDVGTGTGILAILAAMRGARPVEAIEIDEFAYVNAVENVKINNHPEIDVILGDAAKLKGISPADILIANINRNIILGDMGRYSEAIKPGGTAIFSGFYVEDIPILSEAALKSGLMVVNHTERDRWASLLLKKID